MNEIEAIARAQMYLEKLANGINPLNDEEVAEGDIVNNVRISRCLFYTSGILKQIVENNGIQFEREPFNLSPEQLARFEYSDIPLSISEITKRLNALINPSYVKELKPGSITEWLTQINMFNNIIVNNKTKKRLTESGKNIGITSEKRVNQQGFTYEAILYNLNAQHFIIDNIDAVISVNNQKDKK